MGGRIVQLVQGERKELEFEDFEPWIERFANYPIVQLVDLDAAMRTGSNRAAVEAICRRLPCQVGGGIATPARATEILSAGAQRVIIGSALICDGAVNVAAAQEFALAVGRERLVFAIDSRGGNVAVGGWKILTSLNPWTMMQQLEPYCAAFLYTHIDTEGLMTGFPRDIALQLRQATRNQLVVAGGISSLDEVRQLGEIGADAVVGMALYTGALCG